MKNIAFLLLGLILFSGCKQETSTANSKGNSSKTDAKKAPSKIENFDCATFFKEGNYASLCFTDNTSPAYNGAGCIFAFSTKGDKQEENLKIQFTDKNSASLAEMHHNLNKNNYKKGTITEVSNVGDAAYFDIHGTDLKSLSRSNKDLHVQYKNIAFVLMAEYMTYKKKPCFYTNDELIAFANTIIENL